MIPELQAVILAGGEGSKMFPLTEGLPKCLLPIANMPMIWYVVNYLEKSGLKGLYIFYCYYFTLFTLDKMWSISGENCE